MHRNFEFEAHTAFDLEALTVTKTAQLCKLLGERGDFARIVKAKQIAIIESHPVERQAQALRQLGEDPDALRLRDEHPEAAAAIQAAIAPPAAEALPELEEVARQMARLMMGTRGGLDKAAVAEVVREEVRAVVREELRKMRISVTWGE